MGALAFASCAFIYCPLFWSIRRRDSFVHFESYKFWQNEEFLEEFKEHNTLGATKGVVKPVR